LTLYVNPNIGQDILGDQAVVITAGDSFFLPSDVPNLRTAEEVKNEIFIRNDGLLVRQVLQERPPLRPNPRYCAF
jgi:hypothetical protein